MSTPPEESKTNAVIRHDLKNQVTAIKAYAQLLSSKLQQNDQFPLASYAQKIDSKCDKLTELINTLLKD